MRLVFTFHWDDPKGIPHPTRCPYPGCNSTQVRLRQVVKKLVRDAVCEEVWAHRYQCLVCGRTFRVYPSGVSRAHTSQRVQKVALLLYLLGLSYGAVARVLDALGIYLCKSQVYGVVHSTLAHTQGVRRESLFQRARVSGPSCGMAAVQYGGRWLSVRLHIHGSRCWTVEVSGLLPDEVQSLRQRVEPLASIVGAQVRTVGEGSPIRGPKQRVKSAICAPLPGGGDL